MADDLYRIIAQLLRDLAAYQALLVRKAMHLDKCIAELERALE